MGVLRICVGRLLGRVKHEFALMDGQDSDEDFSRKRTGGSKVSEPGTNKNFPLPVKHSL